MRFLSNTVPRVLLPVIVLLWNDGIVSAGSASTSCEGKDAAVCVDEKDKPVIFDVFEKWIEGQSLEGQKFLGQLLRPSSSGEKERDEKEPSKSFFDEIKNAFATGMQMDDGLSSLKDVVGGSINQFISDLKADQDTSNQGDSSNAAFDFVTFFQTVFSDSKNEKSKEESRIMAAEFIQKASDLSHHVQSIKTDRGFLELHDIMTKALGQVTDAVVRNFGHIDWHRLKPFSMLYFLEYMESLLTPSWKRRTHTFAPEVSVKEVKELHKALYLANLAYLDTVDDIKAGLQEESSDWELIYSQLKNAPGEPAHYIALRKDPPVSSSFVRQDYLDVLLVVRGTKDFSDILSDGLLDAVEFRGGYGHAGLVQSGQFIVDHHIGLMHSLLKMSKKDKMKLTIIGHSLGAGAAAIAAIIFNEDEKDIDAYVVAFGCPSLLSKELSESAQPYITTIVSDSDMIPRLSGPTLINAVLDVMSYDWIEKGLSDLRNGLNFVREKWPFDMPEEHTENVYRYIKKLLDDFVRPEIDEIAKTAREDVILMPPGRCTHFYRDGNGVTGQHISCGFFDSLEISRTMVDDHLIGIGYNRLLLDYMRYRLGDYQFAFDQNIV